MNIEEYNNALAKFKKMRCDLLDLLTSLRIDKYINYIRTGNVFSFVIHKRVSDAVLIGQGTAGFQISFPVNLLPIAACEYHSIHVCNDGLVFVCESIGKDDGRVIHIALQTTPALAQFLKTLDVIDIGTYESRKNHSINYKSFQYFKPVDVNANIFAQSLHNPHNWLQQTLTGNSFSSLEENKINIPLNVREYAEMHKGKEVNLDEHVEISAAMLCVSVDEVKSAIISGTDSRILN